MSRVYLGKYKRLGGFIMIGTDSFYYIMDCSGNYYRTNKSNNLVVVSGREEAEIFTLQDANSRISVGKKSHYYIVSPVQENEIANNQEKEQNQEQVQTQEQTQTQNQVQTQEQPQTREQSQTLSQIQTIANQEKDEPTEKNMDSYELEKLDWKAYIEHFIYTSEAVKDYKDELNKELSDIDKKICDVLHFIELCEISSTEAIDLVELLRICRENRREIKDEITMAEAFQNNIGISSNVAKAKQTLKIINGLANRKYKPRKYKELFENCNVKLFKHSIMTNPMDQVNPSQSQKGCEQQMLNERIETPFDNKENNWIDFARKQVEFYQNIEQHMNNLQLDIDQIQQKIGDILYNIEDSKYNVTEGYMIYKDLRNLKKEQRKKEQEIDLINNMIMYINCPNMADICKENLEEMEKISSDNQREIPA